MQITQLFSPQPLTRSVTYRYLGRDGTAYDAAEAVLSQHRLSVVVNGALLWETVCLPEFLPELVLGRLLTEGLITGAGDVASVTISETGAEATVELTHDLPAAPRPLAPVVAVDWEAQWVFRLANRFAQGMPLHDQTFATHSCFLSRGDTELFACEDIGRHNALDKAVGHALLGGIPLRECLLYTSGRMPLDMVTKAIRAGVPLFSGKGAPTAEAVALAQQYGLTLVCGARQDRLKQFAGPAPRAAQRSELFRTRIPVVAFSAYSGTGKTTLIEQLVAHFKAQGLRLAVLKHDGHDFEMDRPGKDTWRFARAGADVTLICSDTKSAMIDYRPRTLQQALSMIKDVDLILVEGYKHSALPRIGICRRNAGMPLPAAAEAYLALVTDDEDLQANTSVPCFGMEDIPALAAFIREKFHV